MKNNYQLLADKYENQANESNDEQEQKWLYACVADLRNVVKLGGVDSAIKTNDRFDRLCNLDISTYYRDIKFYVSQSYLLAAFAYWVVAQNPNKELIEINPALMAFKKHILSYFENPLLPEEMTYDLLASIIHDDSFAEIPEILALNELKPDFIDLGALARNIFYMILREHITQG